MNLNDIAFHLLNFSAPALVLAVLVPLLARPIFRRRTVMPWWGQVLVNFAVGIATLLASLWWLGRDGRMLGYSLLVLAVASSQWLLARGWRR